MDNPQIPGRFIDFHIHFFPDTLWTAIQRWFVDNPGWRFTFTGGWREGTAYLEGREELARYVVFGYAHKPGMARELNRFYFDLAKASPKALVLGSMHQEEREMAAIAHEAFDAGAKGFKIHCQVQGVAPDDPRFHPLYEVVRERGGVVLFHGGNGPFPGPTVGLAKVRPLLDRFPDLKVVVAHLGAFEADAFLREAMARENLWLDTSYTFIDNPTNRMDADVSLVEAAHRRVLFATDFPGICHGYDAAVRAIAALPLSEKARRAIFHDNAHTLLGL